MTPWKECGVDCDDLHEEDGIIQRYVHLTREFEAPTSFHVFALLTLVAAALNRRVFINRKGYALWPNLYVLLHGPSGLGKSIAAGHARDFVFNAAEQDFMVYPSNMTGEGLITMMWQQTQDGVPASGFVYADEMGTLL